MARRHSGRIAALLSAAALGATVISPPVQTPAESKVQEQTASRQNRHAPVVQRANAAAMVAAMIGGGFAIHGQRHEPIWTGRPRASGGRAGFPFRRQRGTRWA